MVKKLYLEVRVPFSLGKKDNKLYAMSDGDILQEK